MGKDSAGNEIVAVINPDGTTLGGGTSATATLANVTSSASSVTLQAANTNRKGWAVYNDSTSTLYVKFGTTASATSYTVQLATGAYFEMPANVVYTGIITGIWSSANGFGRVTELT